MGRERKERGESPERVVIEEIPIAKPNAGWLE